MKTLAVVTLLTVATFNLIGGSKFIADALGLVGITAKACCEQPPDCYPGDPCWNCG